jgi:hypothetical protein
LFAIVSRFERHLQFSRDNTHPDLLVSYAARTDFVARREQCVCVPLRGPFSKSGCHAQ